MRQWRSVHVCLRLFAVAAMWLLSGSADAAQIYVPAGGDLQAALNAAQAGDTILLAPAATFTGNFILPVHPGSTYVTVRSAASETLLPPSGVRISPAYAPYLPVITSPNNLPAIRTAPGAAFWNLVWLEIGPNANTAGDIVDLGDGSSAQNALSLVPHDLILDRVYLRGHPLNGHKRGVGLNSARTTIANCYIADIKAVGADTQAIGGWNGPGPYWIQNNYLEASTQMVMFGGDDPKIGGLVPSDIVVQGNTLSRPVSWKGPILPAPTAVRLLADSGGNLPAGTYGYRVSARRSINGTQVKSPAAAETTVTVGAGSRVTIAWNPVTDAAEYVVYGRTAGGENRYWTTTGTTFTDDGSSGGTSGTPSSTGTVWQVKNLFELKNARRVQVDHNLMENNWAQAQAGTAIVFTPRNQGGNCTWCTVEEVTFEYNVVRSVAAAIQVLGFDNLHPSQQANALRIANNEISDLSKSAWGGNGYFVTITGGPRDITIDHNTIISPGGGGVVLVDGAAVAGFVFTNNVARHNSYGIMSDRGIGNPTIAYYFPNGDVRRNVLAGGRASLYPPDNLFPTTTDFQAHFTDYTGNDFSLRPGTDWANDGTDGRDLGADQGAIRAVAAPSTFAPPQITTTDVPSASEGAAYSAHIAASGGVLPYNWRIAGGTLPPGIVFDTVNATLSGSAAAAGDYAFTVQVADQTSATTSTPFSIHVVQAVDIVTGGLPDATATQAYAQPLTATGGLGTYTWKMTAGTLPDGVTFSSAGLLSGTPSAPGMYAFTATVYDTTDTSRSASRTLSLLVAPPPDIPPTIAITAPTPGGVVPVGATITVAAAGADVDGVVQRVDLYVNDALIGSHSGASLTTSWMIPSPGTYAFTAVATDDRGESTTSAAVTIATKSEVVIYASSATTMVGKYQLSADATAAGGYAMVNPDAVAPKITTASANPASYAEYTFYAEAGRPYHFWMRGKAHRNTWANDSAFVQFSGVATARIGTTSSLTYNLEDDANAGESGWGWQDNGYGLNVLGANITFETTGIQTLRIQPREDGLSFDQIVLSPERYLSTSPGTLKNDTTIVAP